MFSVRPPLPDFWRRADFTGLMFFEARFVASLQIADKPSGVARPATNDDQIDYQRTCTIAPELGSRELQVQSIDLLETRVMQQQGRIVRGQPRPLTELPFHHSTGETHDPNTF
jgi:hypothetical protein